LEQDIVITLTQYGIAGLALYLLYRIAFHELSSLRQEIRELREEVRELRREVREWLSRTQERS